MMYCSSPGGMGACVNTSGPEGMGAAGLGVGAAGFDCDPPLDPLHATSRHAEKTKAPPRSDRRRLRG
jgi:hypothetical protein